MSVADLSSLGTPLNFLNFNDYNASPLFRIIRRTPTRREIEEFDIRLPESLGVADYQTLIGKMYMVLEGKMYPNNEAGFHTGREQLRKLGNVVLQQDDASSDMGYVPYKWSENVGKQLFVKVLYVDVPESTKLGIIQPFRILCKVKYPVILAQQTQSGTLTIGTTANPSGGAVIPAIIPMQIGTSASGTTSLPFVLPVVLGATAGSGSITLNNTGDYHAFPTITIYGPINRPRITYGTTGEYIELDVSLASASNSAVISYDQDSLSITANNVNAYGKLTAGSSLFKVKAGQAVFNLTGSSVGTGATCTVSFYPAWPMS